MNTINASYDVSIITPCYNDARYLNGLYTKLCQQKDVSFEWIIVDDGSTDNSYEVAQEFIKTHTQPNFSIQLTRQENKGAEEARRTAAKMMLSDKVFQLDADDFISDDALMLALEKFTSDEIDMVCLHQTHCTEDGSRLFDANVRNKNWPINGKDVIVDCLCGWNILLRPILKKDLFLESYDVFDKHIASFGRTFTGDEMIGIISLSLARKVTLCDGIYFYTNNPQSITRGVYEDFYTIIFTVIALRNYLKSNFSGHIKTKAELHILGNLFDTHSCYLKWSDQLNNKNDWLKAMLYSLHEINHSRIFLHLIKRLRFRKIVKILRLYYGIWQMNKIAGNS